MTLSN